MLDGLPLLLTRRQLEIVALLALNSAGLGLDALHAHLYGDRPVAPATLKAAGLVECGNYLAVAVREALLADPDPEAVLRYVEAAPYEVDVLERAIAALRRTAHPALPLLRARLEAAYRAPASR